MIAELPLRAFELLLEDGRFLEMRMRQSDPGVGFCLLLDPETGEPLIPVGLGFIPEPDGHVWLPDDDGEMRPHRILMVEELAVFENDPAHGALLAPR